MLFLSPSSSPSPGYSEQIDQALALAALVHQRQQRKGSAVPYLIHPVQVGWIVAHHGYGEELVVTGLLHDVLEDACWEDAALDEAVRSTFPSEDSSETASLPLRPFLEQWIARRFGAQVLEWLAVLSERKTDARGQRRAWHERKAEQLVRLDQAAPEALVVKAADLIHNLRTTLWDVQTAGLAVFARFNAGGADQLEHYASVVQVVGRRLGRRSTLVAELAVTLKALADEIARLAADCSEAKLGAAAQAGQQAAAALLGPDEPAA